jgi:signal transduction histidine kinase
LPENKRARLEELWQETNNIMLGLRRLSQDLRPAALDSLGLIPALEWLASDIAKYSGLAVNVSLVGTQRRFTEEIELVLFRIVQEALRNIWRHAEATEAEITVEFAKDKTRITVTDNGKGFKPPEKISELARGGKLGLAGMEERAQLVGGTLIIKSQPGKGTSITVEIPA